MIILGATFMHSLSIIFDRSNTRIGFVGQSDSVRYIDSSAKPDTPFWVYLTICGVGGIVIAAISIAFAYRVYSVQKQKKADNLIIQRSNSLGQEFDDYDSE